MATLTNTNIRTWISCFNFLLHQFIVLLSDINSIFLVVCHDILHVIVTYKSGVCLKRPDGKSGLTDF
jgi:hypothetical protein